MFFFYHNNQLSPFSNFIKELSTQDLLKYEVKPLRLLEIFDQVDDVLVTLQCTEGWFLTGENTRLFST